MQHLTKMISNKSLPFTQLISILADYAIQFDRMWPFYWLKALAIRDSEIWRLCYISLTARWSDIEPIQEIRDRGNAILAVSQLIDNDKAWNILKSLQVDGRVALLDNINASVGPGHLQLLPFFSCQDHISFQMPNAITDVAESAEWRYLYCHASGAVGWSSDDESSSAWWADLRQRSEPDLRSFASARLGIYYSVGHFECQVDLPLALRVKRGSPNRSTNTLPLIIECRRPLTLETLKMKVGNIWSSDTQTLSINIECSSEEGWSVGEVVIPYTCGKVWFKFENLEKALSYELPIPTPEDQVTNILGHIYHTNSLEEGKRRWGQHLLESDSTNFEIALLNAISRFGIPVLFAGQVQQASQPGGGGTSTTGYDLVALDHARRRAVLISAKGSRRVPTDDDCQKLLDGVQLIQEALHDWYVAGIIACHASDNRLGRFQDRTDLRVWSREDLETLFSADKRETIESLLWAPPSLPGFTDWGLLDSH